MLWEVESQMNFSAIRPSISSLPYEEKLDLIVKIRARRAEFGTGIKKRLTKTISATNTSRQEKRTAKNLTSMSAKEAQALLALLESMEVSDNE